MASYLENGHLYRRAIKWAQVYWSAESCLEASLDFQQWHADGLNRFIDMASLLFLL